MMVIGLTGGIGCGKSTVAREFQQLAVPVYIADDESKKILSEDPSAIREVKQLLGEESYQLTPDGLEVPDKTYIGQQVFENKNLLKSLNEILHPKVNIHFKKWLATQESAYVIYEAAILLESGGDKKCDFVLLVFATEEDRIGRVVQRDGVTEDQVRDRLKNQWTESQRLEKADFIIINDDLDLIPGFVKRMNSFLLKN